MKRRHGSERTKTKRGKKEWQSRRKVYRNSRPGRKKPEVALVEGGKSAFAGKKKKFREKKRNTTQDDARIKSGVPSNRGEGMSYSVKVERVESPQKGIGKNYTPRKKKKGVPFPSGIRAMARGPKRGRKIKVSAKQAGKEEEDILGNKESSFARGRKRKKTVLEPERLCCTARSGCR